MEKRKSTVAFGREGERLIAKRLKEEGYFISATNYISNHGEIDIIAENEKFVIFVEVKTRIARIGYFPREAVTKSKMQHIIYTAENYIYRSHTKLIPRFDVAEIITDENGDFENATVNYFENAFGIDEK